MAVEGAMERADAEYLLYLYEMSDSLEEDRYGCFLDRALPVGVLAVLTRRYVVGFMLMAVALVLLSGVLLFGFGMADGGHGEADSVTPGVGLSQRDSHADPPPASVPCWFDTSLPTCPSILASGLCTVKFGLMFVLMGSQALGP